VPGKPRFGFLSATTLILVMFAVETDMVHVSTVHGKDARRSASTLIELLVVISIISVLMAILVPSLQKVRKMGQAVVCQSRLRQWGQVFHLYACDNENRLAQSIAGGRLSAQDAYWIVATLPYYTEKKIRVCPSTKVVQDAPVNRSHGGTLACWGPFDPATPDNWWADFDTGSYGLNEWSSAPPSGVSQFWGFQTKNAWRTIDARGAAGIPLLLDCVYVDVFPEDDNTPLDDEPPPYQWDNGWGDWGFQAMRMACINRHSGAINSAFLDGSAARIPLRALWKLRWHKNFDTNGGMARPDADWPQWLRGFRDTY
jgi:prepilin-type processing-associated H-X9-DG protein